MTFYYNLTLDFPSRGRVPQSNYLVLSLIPFVSLLTKKYFSSQYFSPGCSLKASHSVETFCAEGFPCVLTDPSSILLCPPPPAG